MSAVQTETYRAPASAGKLFTPTPGLPASLFTDLDQSSDSVELRDLQHGPPSTTSSIEDDNPPSYEDAFAAPNAGPGFHPTLQLQIETRGRGFCTFWPGTPPRPDPIPVFSVGSDGTAPTSAGLARFMSVRPTRCSGSCTLYAGSSLDNAGNTIAGRSALSATEHRFGLGRPPRVALFDPSAAAGAAAAAEPWDAFEIHPRGLLTRAQTFRNRLGSFEWRYATRAERKAAGDVNSLLVLDRIVAVANALNGQASTSAKGDEVRTPVAQLVRSEELRTAGSTSLSAGNGGRLLVDLASWPEEAKTERVVAEVMVVTTCIVMLKKEVDRRRAHQKAMTYGAGGAP